MNAYAMFGLAPKHRSYLRHLLAGKKAHPQTVCQIRYDLTIACFVTLLHKIAICSPETPHDYPRVVKQIVWCGEGTIRSFTRPQSTADLADIFLTKRLLILPACPFPNLCFLFLFRPSLDPSGLPKRLPCATTLANPALVLSLLR